MAKSLITTHQSIPVGPYKLRPVCDVVRGLMVTDAINRLEVIDRSAAKILIKKLKSTISAAIDKSLETQKLFIKSISCDQVGELKRQRIRSRGRAAIMRKRTSSITIELEEK